MANHLSREQLAPAYVLAMLLIVNSHLEPLLPQRWLAVDGLLGNQAFFILAGYAAGRNLGTGRRSMLEFFWRRLRGVMLPVALTLAVSLIFGWAIVPRGILELIGAVVWPTKYGFIAVIVPLWLLAPLLVARGWHVVMTVLSLALFLLALGRQVVGLGWGGSPELGSLSSHMWWAYWGLSFGLGLCGSRMASLPVLRSPVQVVALAISFSAYCASKLAYYYSDSVSPVGLVVMFAAAPVWNCLLLTTFSLGCLQGAIAASRSWMVPLSGVTLHVYITHESLIGVVLGYDLHWLIAWPIYLAFAVLVGFVLRYLERLIILIMDRLPVGVS